MSVVVIDTIVPSVARTFLGPSAASAPTASSSPMMVDSAEVSQGCLNIGYLTETEDNWNKKWSSQGNFKERNVSQGFWFTESMGGC